ncbi:hypothetical protein CHS0354_002890 [Potamilus streckersoni]|uniref:ZP domain-containing protein n=1 Tax=Potamilus streckersoni TaxID=2493646 RepID=A0AAE0VYP9_9BIVA|nr:hypothetical protein CHS0354_002890 [Potamilus streckersoni]
MEIVKNRKLLAFTLLVLKLALISCKNYTLSEEDVSKWNVICKDGSKREMSITYQGKARLTVADGGSSLGCQFKPDVDLNTFSLSNIKQYCKELKRKSFKNVEVYSLTICEASLKKLYYVDCIYSFGNEEGGNIGIGTNEEYQSICSTYPVRNSSRTVTMTIVNEFGENTTTIFSNDTVRIKIKADGLKDGSTVFVENCWLKRFNEVEEDEGSYNDQSPISVVDSGCGISKFVPNNQHFESNGSLEILSPPLDLSNVDMDCCTHLHISCNFTVCLDGQECTAICHPNKSFLRLSDKEMIWYKKVINLRVLSPSPMQLVHQAMEPLPTLSPILLKKGQTPRLKTIKNEIKENVIEEWLKENMAILIIVGIVLVLLVVVSIVAVSWRSFCRKSKPEFSISELSRLDCSSSPGRCTALHQHSELNNTFRSPYVCSMFPTLDACNIYSLTPFQTQMPCKQQFWAPNTTSSSRFMLPLPPADIKYPSSTSNCETKARVHQRRGSLHHGMSSYQLRPISRSNSLSDIYDIEPPEDLERRSLDSICSPIPRRSDASTINDGLDPVVGMNPRCLIPRQNNRCICWRGSNDVAQQMYKEPGRPNRSQIHLKLRNGVRGFQPPRTSSEIGRYDMCQYTPGFQSYRHMARYQDAWRGLDDIETGPVFMSEMICPTSR